jgi:hypothetical protein
MLALTASARDGSRPAPHAEDSRSGCRPTPGSFHIAQVNLSLPLAVRVLGDDG